MVIIGSISGSSAHEMLTRLSKVWEGTPKKAQTFLDRAGIWFPHQDFELPAEDADNHKLFVSLLHG